MLWNSSGGRMTCAPRRAASRTKPSVLAILAFMSWPKDDWMAATVIMRFVIYARLLLSDAMKRPAARNP